jgi:hypothetical protein
MMCVEVVWKNLVRTLTPIFDEPLIGRNLRKILI